MKRVRMYPMTEAVPMRGQTGNGLFSVAQWNGTRNGQTTAPYDLAAYPDGYDDSTDPEAMGVERAEGAALYPRQAAAAWSPILLLTVGPLAETIAATTTAVGTEWQPHLPPMRTIALSAAGTAARDRQLVGRQLDAFCAQMRANALARETWQDAGGDQPLQSWLLLDLYVDEQGELADTLINRRLTEALYMLQSFTTATCRHSFISPSSTPHDVAVQPTQLLLIADPSRPDDLQRCQRRLASLLADPLYVVGAARDEVESLEWQARVATALGALLWVVPSSRPDEPPMAITETFYTIGAAASPLPTAGLPRVLGLLAAHEAVSAALTRLHEVPETATQAPTLPNVHATLIADLLSDEPSLHAAVPPPTPIRLRRTTPRWWRATANPVQILLAHAYRQQQPDRAAIREARRHWLTTQLATWSAASDAESQGETHSLQSDPLQLLPEATLEGMRQQILMAAQSIEEALAAVTTAAEQQERTVQVHRQSVGDLCATLPTFTIDGLWYGLRRPRRWLRWAQQLTFGLSQQLRLLSKQLSIQQELLHQEANLHLRRQLALAMLQDVQQLLAWRRELATHLAALQRYLDDHFTAAHAQLSIPLDRQQCAQLYRQLLQDGAITRQVGVRALAALLHPTAADEWVDGSPALIGEALLDEFTTPLMPLASWSVEEWFATAFPHATPAQSERPAADAPDQQALTQWLDQLAKAVTMLWPQVTGHSSQSTTQADWWLYWPEQPTTSFDPEGWQPAAEVPVALQQWLAYRATTMLCRGPIQSAIIVQRLGLTDM